VSPGQLNTTGYTHLYYAFAAIDPSSFAITPADPSDVATMREFTGLSAFSSVQTWIAVGGFDMSDVGTPTHTTWSDLCSTKANRAAFISSVKAYMDEYGFQGVDIDWEYPGAPERGGRQLTDTRNLILLMKEMRAAFGTRYGISMTLAPDYWYLRWFDAKAMEPYVDFFGFMAYDLHGSWDADVSALGSLVRGQTNIREISNDTLPLWFDGLNPAKINFGLAMYGRGYTLADPSCNQMLCPFSGPSKPAPCTNFDGVMSLLEVQQLIEERGLKPQYLPGAMMKQITWDDQWIGYDDEETFAAKKAWADSQCFGGSMVWSIDFQLPGSGGPAGGNSGGVVYVGSEVYQQPTAQCEPPCIMVFPPSTLDKPTAITFEPYTATLQVGTTTTTVVAVPPVATITLTVISFFNYYVTSEQQPGQRLTLLPSIQAPPVPVVVTGPDGHTTTRTVVPPPLGAGGSSGGSSPSSSAGSGNPAGPGHSSSAASGNPAGSGNPTGPGQTAGGDDPLPPMTTWPFLPPPTPTTAMLPDPSDPDNSMPAISLPETDLSPTGSGGAGTGTITTTASSTSTTVAFPWPFTGSIEPVTDKNKPKPTAGTRVSCKSWFFFICISWGDLDVEFWDIDLPPGRIGPSVSPFSFFNHILPHTMTY
jgi:chitinase